MSTRDHATLAEYLSRPYPVRLNYSEEDQCWFVRYPDLPGCLADGATKEEALQHGEEAKELWIEGALEHAQRVPEPSIENDEYSGRILVRAPKDLHRQLAVLAERQGTSMNQLIVTLLSRATAVTDTVQMAERMLRESIANIGSSALHYLPQEQLGSPPMRLIPSTPVLSRAMTIQSETSLAEGPGFLKWGSGVQEQRLARA